MDKLEQMMVEAENKILAERFERENPASGNGTPKPDGRQPEPPRFTKLLTCEEFLALDLRQNYLIDRVLAEGQPGVSGGRSKTLKTSLAIDMAISLGSGTPFLGMFEAQRVNVAFWSGESGAPTIRETARRIAEARQVELSDCSIQWGFDLPKLGRLEHLDAMRGLISDHGLHVVIVDPLYLSLLDASTAGQAGNVYAMGAALHPLAEMAQETGVTLVVLHHFKKSAASDPDEPASLESLSQSGIVEWARQWLLLERRSPYQTDGRHELWMRCGGSAGHAGLWAVDVEEGVFNPDAAGGGRWWDVEVRPAIEARVDDEKRRRDEKETAKVKRLEEQAADDRRRMLDALKKRTPPGDTLRALRELAGIPSSPRAGDAIRTLLGEGRAEQVEVKKHTRKEQGYRWIDR